MTYDVLFFMADLDMQHLYVGWTQRHLQPSRVRWNYHAEGVDAFLELSRSYQGRWGMLITDLLVIRQHEDAVSQFVIENPQAVVGIERQLGYVSAAPVAGGILFDRPADLDGWLGIVNRLLAP